MSTPRDSHADAAVWRSACNPSSGAAGQFRFPGFLGGITPAAASAGFHASRLKMFRLTLSPGR
jgi:hypothetical protein